MQLQQQDVIAAGAADATEDTEVMIAESKCFQQVAPVLEDLLIHLRMQMISWQIQV